MNFLDYKFYSYCKDLWWIVFIFVDGILGFIRYMYKRSYKMIVISKRGCVGGWFLL